MLLFSLNWMSLRYITVKILLCFIPQIKVCALETNNKVPTDGWNLFIGNERDTRK